MDWTLTLWNDGLRERLKFTRQKSFGNFYLLPALALQHDTWSRHDSSISFRLFFHWFFINISIDVYKIKWKPIAKLWFENDERIVMHFSALKVAGGKKVYCSIAQYEPMNTIFYNGVVAIISKECPTKGIVTIYDSKKFGGIKSEAAALEWGKKWDGCIELNKSI